MKPYAYYPGCSLEKNALSYHQSSEAVANALGGIRLKDLPLRPERVLDAIDAAAASGGEAGR